MTHRFQRGGLVGIPPQKRGNASVGATACVSANMDMGENHQNLKVVFAILASSDHLCLAKAIPVLEQTIFQLFCSKALENS